MKTILASIIVLGLTVGLIAAGPNSREELKDQLIERYRGKTFIVKKRGIPAVAWRNSQKAPYFLTGRKRVTSIGGREGVDHYFAPGDRVKIRPIRIDPKGIRIHFESADIIELPINAFGKRRQSSVVAKLYFPFPKEVIKNVDLDKIFTTIEEWIEPERNKVAIALSPLERVELKLGMSVYDVIRALGQPKKIIQIENKEYWTYDAFTIVMVDEKVREIK